MTACVNRKHTKNVAAVVTASLVGALSLGVAPRGRHGHRRGHQHPERVRAGGLGQRHHHLRSRNQGYIIDDPSNIEFEVGSGSKYPMVLEVTPEYATKEVRVSQKDVEYYRGATKINPETIHEAGTYTMVIKAPSTSGGLMLRIASMGLPRHASSLAWRRRDLD
ncbi:hypothetical protein [Collinsella tanakaei]|uniref:hypothetical protein n=1 Tax=Collinsella tanakaei TaxID=626935 RepID=UPI00195A2B77|nr:hypothetical protein [Collinsella tanakaei]MBM6868174.1 hypothetical protein [Collinsella tanakaei]